MTASPMRDATDLAAAACLLALDLPPPLVLRIAEKRAYAEKFAKCGKCKAWRDDWVMCGTCARAVCASCRKECADCGVRFCPDQLSWCENNFLCDVGPHRVCDACAYVCRLCDGALCGYDASACSEKNCKFARCLDDHYDAELFVTCGRCEEQFCPEHATPSAEFRYVCKGCA